MIGWGKVDSDVFGTNASECSATTESTASFGPVILKLLKNCAISSLVDLMPSLDVCTSLGLSHPSIISSNFHFLPCADVKSMSFIGRYCADFSEDGNIQAHWPSVHVLSPSSLFSASK